MSAIPVNAPSVPKEARREAARRRAARQPRGSNRCFPKTRLARDSEARRFPAKYGSGLRPRRVFRTGNKVLVIRAFSRKQRGAELRAQDRSCVACGNAGIRGKRRTSSFCRDRSCGRRPLRFGALNVSSVRVSFTSSSLDCRCVRSLNAVPSRRFAKVRLQTDCRSTAPRRGKEATLRRRVRPLERISAIAGFRPGDEAQVRLLERPRTAPRSKRGRSASSTGCSGTRRPGGRWRSPMSAVPRAGPRPPQRAAARSPSRAIVRRRERPSFPAAARVGRRSRAVLQRVPIRARLNPCPPPARRNSFRAFPGRRIAQPLTPGLERRGYFGSAAAEVPGSFNIGGISDPAVDALIEEVVAASSRAELTTAGACARPRPDVEPLRDRPVVRGRVQHRVQVRSAVSPKFDMGVLDTWWCDREKAAAVARGNAPLGPPGALPPP